jgi:hypothetical protein
VGTRNEENAGREPAPAARAAFGYRGTVACAAAGITYRQLDYWARTGLVGPTLRAGSGPGLYSFRDVVILKPPHTSADSYQSPTAKGASHDVPAPAVEPADRPSSPRACPTRPAPG